MHIMHIFIEIFILYAFRANYLPTHGVYREGFWGGVSIINIRNNKKSIHSYSVDVDMDVDMDMDIDIAVWTYKDMIRIDKNSLYVYIDIYIREKYIKREAAPRGRRLWWMAPLPQRHIEVCVADREREKNFGKAKKRGPRPEAPKGDSINYFKNLKVQKSQ